MSPLRAELPTKTPLGLGCPDPALPPRPPHGRSCVALDEPALRRRFQSDEVKRSVEEHYVAVAVLRHVGTGCGR